jgi:galactokinase
VSGVPDAVAALQSRVAAGFRAAFGRPPEVLAFAPGRVNLIGEHTDYNDGFVLPCALEQGTLVAVARRPDRRIELRALDLVTGTGEPAADAFALDSPAAALQQGHWANHPRGMVAAWRDAGSALPGLDVAVGGDLPRGAGLSSSASFGVALATAFSRIVGVDPGAVSVARMAQRAENLFVGCACGIMDPLAAAAAREGAALLIDCRSLSWDEVAVPEQAAVLVVHSGVSRELADGAYNARRAECERAARFFGVAALRDLAGDAVAAAPAGLDATAYRLIDVNELLGKMAVLGTLVILLWAVYGFLLYWMGGAQKGLFPLDHAGTENEKRLLTPKAYGALSGADLDRCGGALGLLGPTCRCSVRFGGRCRSWHRARGKL